MLVCEGVFWTGLQLLAGVVSVLASQDECNSLFVAVTVSGLAVWHLCHYCDSANVQLYGYALTRAVVVLQFGLVSE